MVMYDRANAPGELKLRFHIRNKRGEDILGALRYDPETGTGYMRIPGNTTAEFEFFDMGGYVEIAGHVNPLPEEMDAIYASARSHLSQEATKEVVREIIEQTRNEREQQEPETTPEPEQPTE